MERILQKIFDLFVGRGHGICKGCKKITPGANYLDYASWVYNDDSADATLNYEDEYGNADTITLASKQTTNFRCAKVNTGSGSKLFQIYTK